VICIQAQTWILGLNFIKSESSNQIPSNFIDFQTLELHGFLIQILSWILKSYNKEGCSLFNSLQIYILFEIVQSRECHIFIESIQVHLIFLNESQMQLFISG
jgi:hypothetical protein